jgi:hypothetical protein
VLNLDGAARMQEAVWVEPGAEAEPLLAAVDRAGEAWEIPLAVGQVSPHHRRFAAAGFPAVGLSVGLSGLRAFSARVAPPSVLTCGPVPIKRIGAASALRLGARCLCPSVSISSS